jgi:hypothetical protein
MMSALTGEAVMSLYNTPDKEEGEFDPFANFGLYVPIRFHLGFFRSRKTSKSFKRGVWIRS